MKSGGSNGFLFYLMHLSKINETKLAENCHCAISTISRIVRGEATPHDELRCRIARAIHIDPKALTKILNGDESAYCSLFKGAPFWRVRWSLDPYDVPHIVTMTSVPIPGFELACKMARFHQERLGGSCEVFPAL